MIMQLVHPVIFSRCRTFLSVVKMDFIVFQHVTTHMSINVILYDCSHVIQRYHRFKSRSNLVNPIAIWCNCNSTTRRWSYNYRHIRLTIPQNYPQCTNVECNNLKSSEWFITIIIIIVPIFISNHSNSSLCEFSSYLYILWADVN